MGRGNGSGGRAGRPLNSGGRVRRGVAPGGIALAEQPAPQAVAPIVPAPVERRIPEFTQSSDYEVRNIGGGDKMYTFEVGGNTVRMSSTLSSYDGQPDASFNFDVNNSLAMSRRLSQDVKDAIAARLMGIMRDEARSRPDGFRYHVSAYNDGDGQKRAIAYSSVGFTRPRDALVGDNQYGIVRNGKIVPDTARLQQSEGSYFNTAESRWGGAVRAFRARRNAERRDRIRNN